jgi:hypothetical protein
MEKHALSKSTFVRGIQCHKSLYLNKYHPELRDELSPKQEAIFERGTAVGKHAQKLFPDGIDVSPESYYDFSTSLKKTQEMIHDGANILYEAAFQYDGVLAVIDILCKDTEGWKLYEVKSSTNVSETHILDASLQYHVITHSGTQLVDIFVVYINNEYIRQRELETTSLFNSVSVLNEVNENQKFVQENISVLKEILKGKNVPDIDISEHCNSPYECDFTGHCWQHIPEDSIFDISRLGNKKKFELYHEGIIELKDIPNDYALNKTQQIQITSAISKTIHIDKEGIKDFLGDIPYPLYFLDFETFAPAIPLFDNTRPYQKIAFQYSLHYKKDMGEETKHFEFLGEGKTDPRKPLVEKLLCDTKNAGYIIVYNKTFEKSVLKDLAKDFPEYSEDIQERITRIKDLMIPFREKLYYAPQMQGSYSIKSVLPALVPHPPVSYVDLEISNGDLAMGAYELLHDEVDTVKIEKTRKALTEYCRLDTLAMVWILEVLENCIRK